MKNTKTLITYLCAATYSIICGMVFIANKACTAYSIPFVVLAYRYFFSSGASFVMQRAGGLHVSYKGKGRRGILCLAGLAYMVSTVFQIYGLAHAASVLNGMMFATVPIWAELLSLLILKEKTSFSQNVFSVLSISAIIVMFWSSMESGQPLGTLQGFLLLTVASALDAFNTVLVRYLREEYTPAEIGYASSLVAFGGICVILAFQYMRGELTLSMFMLPLQNPQLLAAIIYLGVGCTFVTSLLKGHMLRNLTTLKASIWSNFTTIISLFAGVILLHEPLHGVQVVCAAFVIVSVLGIQLCGVKWRFPRRMRLRGRAA